MVPVLLNIHHLGKPQALLEDQTVRVSQEMETLLLPQHSPLESLYPVGFFRLSGARY